MSDKRKNGQTINCHQCGVPTYISPSRLKKNKIHHCSVKCSAITNSARYSQKVEVACYFCKKPIFYKPSRIKNIAYPTCSKECSYKIRSETYRKDNNPRALGLNDFDKFFWERNKIYARRAKAKNIPFDLDYLFLKNLFEKQRGLCYYSDLKMQLDSIKDRENQAASYDVASLDRTNPELGYTKDNVVWTLNCINMFKAHHSMKHIREVMIAITEKEKRNED